MLRRAPCCESAVMSTRPAPHRTLAPALVGLVGLVAFAGAATACSGGDSGSGGASTTDGGTHPRPVDGGAGPTPSHDGGGGGSHDWSHHPAPGGDAPAPNDRSV